MGITVLKRGTRPVEPKSEWQGKCDHCGCVMHADEWPLIKPPAMPEPFPNGKPYDPQSYFCERCATCEKPVVMWKKTVT